MALGYAASYDFSGLGEADIYDGRVQDFMALLKPGVMTLVVFTGIAGMAIAPGFADMHPFMILVAILCLTVGSGAAGAINMWYDRDIDAIMTRTQKRPIPAGRIKPNEALSFGVILTLLSVMVMGLAINWMAAAILAFASFFYVFIYTMFLKRRTPQNIVIGGAAGAFPPIIGWICVTGEIALYPLILFAIVFLWTPPHFWALALYKNPDYKKAGVPMMPAVKGIDSTKRQMLIYTFILSFVCLLPVLYGYAGPLYMVGTIALNTVFLIYAMRVWLEESLKVAKTMFGYSIFYLFALFSIVMIDHAFWG